MYVFSIWTKSNFYPSIIQIRRFMCSLFVRYKSTNPTENTRKWFDSILIYGSKRSGANQIVTKLNVNSQRHESTSIFDFTAGVCLSTFIWIYKLLGLFAFGFAFRKSPRINFQKVRRSTDCCLAWMNQSRKGTRSFVIFIDLLSSKYCIWIKIQQKS